MSTVSVRRAALGTQGAYYLLTGVWAIAHRRSFEAVSGRKTDYWLVRTVGALAAALGASLLVEARREARPGAAAETAAAGSAVAFGAVDALCVGSGRISRVYLADLVAQAAFLAALPLTRRRRSRRRFAVRR